MRLPTTPPLLSLDVGATIWRFWQFDAHFWGCPENCPPDFVACFLDFDGALGRLWKSDHPHALRERLRLMVGNQGFFRVVELHDGAQILLHRSQCFVFATNGDLARFWTRGPHWIKTAWLLKTPGEELVAALERERKRRDSDLSRAFKWLSLPRQERAFAGLQWTTGNAEDLGRLVSAAFWCCDELWDGTRDTYDYALFAQPGREFLAESGVRDPDAPRHFRPLPPKLARLLAKIVARNKPFWPPGVQLNRDVGSGPLAQKETRRTGTLLFPINEPSAHQQLEARLELREFLQSEAPELLAEWF